MKGSEQFKQTIQKYLEDRAASDSLFAVTYSKENKNIDGCVSYILSTVQASGCNGFTDDEIYNMAVHYYDEDSINPSKDASNLRIVVNHKVELTEEEKAALQEKAHKMAEDEYLKSLKKKATPTAVKKSISAPAEKKQKVKLPSLFGDEA